MVAFSITCPILMLHAADDHVIPVKLARLLKVYFRVEIISILKIFLVENSFFLIEL